MLELIQKIIFEVTGKKGLTMDTDFVQDLGLNSFDIINVVTAFEEHFKTTIPTRDVWQLRKVYNVVDYLKEKGFTKP